MAQDEQQITGHAVTIGDNISANEILSPEFYGEGEEALTPSLAFATSDINLSAEGEIILVTGSNFAHGSVNESVVTALQNTGAKAIVGSEFPQYFYRNALNLGLPVLVAPDAASEIKSGQTLEIDTKTGSITMIESGREYQSEERPDFITRLMEMQGVTGYIRALKSQEAGE
ncbi:MAG: hypothetical protein K9N46_11105 [Candidatus Marinimicrobia bacterium]|nr:hypothetical protein [Candidatus Neomarinimicrobiota bacterium]MCF7827670.1 hypothetical protein [Candidatus Neomarinimicrobiota bacterium]MCF7881275.1 hypothetical protein [Candidatus Neomarinimicrobiota bacterium]